MRHLRHRIDYKDAENAKRMRTLSSFKKWRDSESGALPSENWAIIGIRLNAVKSCGMSAVQDLSRRRSSHGWSEIKRHSARCGDNDDGACDVSDWTDVVAVSAGSEHTVGLKSDGTGGHWGK